MKKTARTVFALAFALLLAAQPAAAVRGTEPSVTVDPVGQPDNYSAVLYDNMNGLPTASINTVAQTSDGFLWFGSYSGLIRYDGSSFALMDTTTGINSVMALFVDSRDRLWIGTNENGVALMEQGGFRIWNEDDGLGAAKIRAIVEDANGAICVGTAAGILMIEPDLTLHPVEDPMIADTYLDEIIPGNDGLLYCLTYDGDVFTMRDGKAVHYIDHSKIPFTVSSIYPDPAAPGSLYLGTLSSAFYRCDMNGRDYALEEIDISPLFEVQQIKRFGDQLWICATNGIGVLDEQGFHFLDGLPLNSSISKVIADYEGNLWFTSDRQGVMKLVSNRFADYLARFNIPSQVINATCMFGDSLLVATNTGLLVLNENEQVSSIPLTAAKTASGVDLGSDDLVDLLDGCPIRSILRDGQGRLWLSTWRDLGLLRYDRGELTAFTEADGFLSNRVRAISETSDGRILAACASGMCVIEGDRVTATYGESDGLANPVSLSVCAAPNGDALLGTNGSGVYIINDEGVRNVGTQDGLSSGVIMHIKYDAARDLFWLVTGDSIAYMTSDYQVTTVSNFPYSDNSDLYENSRGDMWILSSDGIYVVPTQQLIANEEIKPAHYGVSNGLSSVTNFNSYCELTPEGDLYMAGTAGVVKFNIEQPIENVTNLKQSVPFLDADGVRIYPDETGGFTLSHSVKKLTIYSYVFNYSLSDPEVSYRLEGFDTEDTTVKRSELRPVSYTNLRGGNYSFVMELKDAMGRGSKTVSVSIVKAKALYEQTWFICLCVAADLALLVLMTWMINRRKVRALEKKQREAAERERLSSELNMASRIQSSMLPSAFPAFPDRSEFEIFASMAPAREVGGDFYDFFLIDDDHLAMLIADVSGKGVPAALFMMTVRTMLKGASKSGLDPAGVLESVNAQICENNPEDMFVTVWLGCLELSTGRLIWADAGHEQLFVRTDGAWKLLPRGGGIALGFLEPEFLEDDPPFRNNELLLKPGDAIFQYTDGVAEAMTEGLEQFGCERLLEALNDSSSAEPETLLSHVRAAIDAFVQGAPQFDDITMLSLRYRGGSGEA